MDEPTLLLHLRELVDAQLVSAVSPAAFAFRHALTREAVYATLLKRQRVAYHALVAETLEGEAGQAAPAAARAADLAYHYREAANWPKALEYSQRAGEQAQSQYAPREAAQHFSHALAAAAQLGQPPDLRLLRERGQAYETIGEFELARADYELGLRQARTAGAADAEWQALLDLGFLWAGRDYPRTGVYLQQALELAQASGDPLRVAQSLNRLGNWLVNTGQMELGLQRHHAALELFRAQGSAKAMAATHDLLSLTYSFIGNMPACTEHLQQAIQLFRQTGDKHGLISSLSAHVGLAHMTDMLPWMSQPLPTSYREAAEAADLAQQIGWQSGLAEVQWMFGLTLANFGELGPALARTNDALRTASEIDHRQWITAIHFTFGYIHLVLLEPEIAAGHLALARSMAGELGSAWWIGYSSAFLAFVHLQLGQVAAAQAELQSAASAMALEPGWPARAPRTLIDRYMCWAWAEAALANGQPAEALAIAQGLIESVVNPTSEPIPQLLKLKGQALLALDQPAAAEAAFALALRGARDHRTLPIQWQIHRARARLAQRQGQAEDEARELQAADVLVDQLANTLDEPERSAFRQRASSLNFSQPYNR